MGVMESSDGEFEFLRQLGSDICERVMLGDSDSSHPNETVEIGSFVAMGLHLDTAAKDLNELFPFQFFREFTKTLPSSGQGFPTVSILSFLELSRLVVSILL